MQALLISSSSYHHHGLFLDAVYFFHGNITGTYIIYFSEHFFFYPRNAAQALEDFDFQFFSLSRGFI